MDSFLVQILSSAISTLTIISCLYLKVPQILNIKETRSAEGIYVQAILLEIAGYTIVTLYNYTYSYSVMTYLEYPIILIQTYVLLYYVLKIKGLSSSPLVSIGTLLYLFVSLGFVIDLLPKDVLTYSVPLCTPLSGSAKITYMYGIYKAGKADNVSMMTWLISVLTNLSRLFTVYVDSGDVKLMINFLVSTVLSGGVLATALYYQIYNKLKLRRQRIYYAIDRHDD